MNPLLLGGLVLVAAVTSVAREPAGPSQSRVPPATVSSAGRGAASSNLSILLASTPADSLVAPLRRFETQHGHDADGAQAALVLGRLHFARGEYVQAAAAFARASARLDPARKAEARYGLGLSWLALRQPEPARAALEEVAASASPWASDARLGMARAWELAGRPDRAFDELGRLLQSDPGEAGPSALERYAALAERLHKADAAGRARARLRRDYPHSIEAASASVPVAAATGDASGAAVASTVVQIGVFESSAHARDLARAAQHEGFRNADVVTRGEGVAKRYVVRLGEYPNATEARVAGESAARRLRVAYQVVERGR